MSFLSRLKNVESFKNCNQPLEIINALTELVATQSGMVLLAGKNGTGKTYAAKCVYNAFLLPVIHPDKDEEKAYFRTQAEFQLTLENQRNKYGEILSYLSEVRKAKVFIIDDVGTRTPTEALMDFIYSVVDYRYNENLATIVTTNKNSNELRLIFGDAFISRVASGKVFRFEGEDRRRQDF